ncbi:hypothetical protein ADP8_05072 [Roseomonas mucosa]|nr:hypothetical protein ADP8_05072 [Roseomonas mucosa]
MGGPPCPCPVSGRLWRRGGPGCGGSATILTEEGAHRLVALHLRLQSGRMNPTGTVSNPGTRPWCGGQGRCAACAGVRSGHAC